MQVAWGAETLPFVCGLSERFGDFGSLEPAWGFALCLIAKGNLAFGIVWHRRFCYLIYVNSLACSFCNSVICANSPRRKC